MTTHHNDDDAWLKALASKNNVMKNPETDLLRDKLRKKHIQLLENIGTSTNEIDAIRRRLNEEGLLRQDSKEFWWQGFTGWLTQHHSAWAVASMLFLVGVVSMQLFNKNEILKGTYDTVRGKWEGQKTKNESGVFEGVEISGRQTQLVNDLKAAKLEWEADLISSGLDYKIAESEKENDSVNIHIKLSDNIELLDEDHRRVFGNSLRSGEFILTLDLLKGKNQ